MTDNVIEVIHLQKSFGDNVVLRDINFSVRRGEVVCIIGRERFWQIHHAPLHQPAGGRDGRNDPVSR